MTDQLPLLEGTLSHGIAWQANRLISRGEFLADVAHCAQALPDRSFVINLCTDRYHFLVAFAAVVARGACNLLIAARQPDAVAETLQAYPDTCIAHDGDTPAMASTCPSVRVERAAAPVACPGTISVSADALAAIVFTSGSTGAAKPILKSWRALWTGARINHGYLSRTGSVDHIVATVPPWHMYGLEWSVMVPLASTASVFSGDTFYPRDIHAALASVDAARCLVTTPVHMRALVGSGLEFAATSRIVSATAPLEPALARQVEQLLHGRLFEIYGCSEAGSVAWRLPSEDPAWRFFEELAVQRVSDSATLSAAHLDSVVALTDVLVFADDGTFQLVGRDGDLVKIAGKRASLSELTERLLTIEGVEDGVIFNPGKGGEAQRLAALVASGTLDADQVRTQLMQLVDPVFLPRPMRVVDRLPRTDAGKLRHSDLVEALDVKPGHH